MASVSADLDEVCVPGFSMRAACDGKHTNRSILKHITDVMRISRQILRVPVAKYVECVGISGLGLVLSGSGAFILLFLILIAFSDLGPLLALCS